MHYINIEFKQILQIRRTWIPFSIHQCKYSIIFESIIHLILLEIHVSALRFLPSITLPQLSLVRSKTLANLGKLTTRPIKFSFDLHASQHQRYIKSKVKRVSELFISVGINSKKEKKNKVNYVFIYAFKVKPFLLFKIKSSILFISVEKQGFKLIVSICMYITQSLGLRIQYMMYLNID